MKLLVLTVLGAIVGAIVGNPLKIEKVTKINSGGKIIGGNPVELGQYPFAAAIYYDTISDGHFFCAGALYSRRWIITAAHCVYEGTFFEVRLGISELSDYDDAVIINSTYAIAHPGFNDLTLENDIALIRLSEFVDFTDFVKPILLATTEIEAGKVLKTLGWGYSSDNDYLSKKLNSVQVTALNNEQCNTAYGNDVIIDTMVCTVGVYNEGTCRGDSGGPLFINIGTFAWQFGVASFISREGCESRYPSGFTRTYPYIKWIRNETDDK